MNSNKDGADLLNELKEVRRSTDITAQTRLERKKGNSELRYRRLFETAPDAILILDGVTGKIVDANPFIEILLGFTHKYLVGKSLWEIGALKDRLASKVRMKELIDKRYVRYDNIPLVSKNGQQIPVEIVANVYEEDHKSVIQCNIRDISENKRQEELLIESEQRHRMLASYNSKLNEIFLLFAEAESMEALYAGIADSFHSLVGAIAVTYSVYNKITKTLTVVSLSGDPAYKQIFGAILGQLLEMQIPVSPNIYEQMRNQVLFRAKGLGELTAGLISNEVSDSIMSTIGCKQIVALAVQFGGELFGSCVAYLAKEQLLVPDDSLKTYLHMAGQAIKQMQMKEFLKKSEEKYRIVADYTADWETWLSPEENYIYVSPSCRVLTGFEPEAFLNNPNLMLKIIHPDDREIYINHRKAIQASSTQAKTLSESIDFRIFSLDGKEHWINHVCGKVLDSSGKFLGIRSSNRDVTERKQWENQVLLSANRFRQLFNNMSNGVAIYTPTNNGQDFILSDLNQAGEKIDNVSKKKVLGKSILDIFPNVNKFGLLEVLQRVWQTGKSEKNLSYFYQDNRVSGWRDNNVYKLPTSEIVVVYEDITGQKQAIDALRESENRYRTIVNNANEGIILQEASGHIQAFNKEASRVFGLTTEQAVQHTSTSRTWNTIREDGSNLPGAKHPSMITLATGKPCKNIIMGVKQESDTMIWLNVNTSPLFKENQTEPYAVVISFTDITEVKLANESIRKSEAKLRESEKKYRSLFEDSTDAIYITTRKGEFQEFNASLSNLLGYSKEELQLMPVSNIYKDPLVRAKLINILEKDGFVKDFDAQFVNKDGSVIDSIINANTWLSPDGEIGGFRGIAHDITERKRIEAERIQNNNDLLGAMRSAVEAIAAMTEMRDPYTSGHQKRVAKLAVAIARELGTSDQTAEGIGLASTIHDIGKITVPAEILSKPGHLSDVEYRLIKGHPEAAAEILKTIKFPWQIAKIIMQHHERVDGSGYPFGLKGHQICLEAKIIAVADVVESMSSHRPYRAALGVDAALAEIVQKKGVIYDPEVVDVCVRVFAGGFKLE
jgi:PAS domain S-box-containing protein/putative nucleotidyltransferase with HDIG domain